MYGNRRDWRVLLPLPQAGPAPPQLPPGDPSPHSQRVPSLSQTIRIAVIARGEKVAEAKAAGADLAGHDDLVDSIAGGAMDFDLLIATPT